mmetsp:Transcript_50185/g.60564  ORF Transcript_50185/g.60564 Transcript_50185/m.60564 type:complete len:116 (+) Transcript_50185:299-646(+)
MHRDRMMSSRQSNQNRFALDSVQDRTSSSESNKCKTPPHQNNKLRNREIRRRNDGRSVQYNKGKSKEKFHLTKILEARLKEMDLMEANTTIPMTQTLILTRMMRMKSRVKIKRRK